jgi:predicted ATPase
MWHDVRVYLSALRRRTPYADVEHVQLLKAFLNDPQRFLQHFR